MIRFQTATTNEAPSISDLVNSAYRGDYSRQGWTTEADLLDGQRTDAEAISEIIRAPMNQIELLFEGRSPTLLGCVHLLQQPPEALYFGMLTIEPTLQAQGLGKLLLGRAEQIARAYGYKKLRCSVIPRRTELIAFYERRGFKATGAFLDFPQEEKFGIAKVSDLRLQVFEKDLA